MTEIALLPGRSCGGCTLCCKVFDIKELDSPQGEYCRHCVVGTGCGIWATREPVCRNFYCAYLHVPEIGEHWYPNRSQMILIWTPDRITVHVDTARPRAWREEPYYTELRRWAMLGSDSLRQVIVYVGRHCTAMLPDRDVDLGELDGDENIVTRQLLTPIGVITEVLALKADDPRLEEILAAEQARQAGLN